MKAPILTVPPRFRRGDGQNDQLAHIDGGRDLLAYMTEILGYESLADCRVLDMGCGTKFTQAALKYDIPIAEYVGVDVYREMIEFLNQKVSDDRFSFHHMNLHNEMYNPGGRKLSAATDLPLDRNYFDVVCLFSVFTHLAPEDYADMLKLLRPYVKNDAKLIYSLYLDERTGSGHGLIEQVADEFWQPSGEGFRDAYAGKPLQWAVYSRDFAIELIEDTGWKLESVCLPNEYAQHQFICRPKP